ncbi:hypothetical protein ELX89_23870 [Escherichia coli]|nr:hypothetical protein ELX89_26105 [Escherichia coli]TFO02954.1 hypothetical protein ELX89_23870 [Escherichia coli]
MGRWWRYKWITFHPSLTAVRAGSCIRPSGGWCPVASATVPAGGHSHEQVRCPYPHFTTGYIRIPARSVRFGCFQLMPSRSMDN